MLGDVSYVWAQLEYEAERDKKPNKWHRWSDHYSPAKLRALIAARSNGTVDEAVHLDAVRSLRKLYEVRAEEGLERRTRAAQKCRYLTALIPVLLASLVALSASINEVAGGGIWKEIALAASAGALGATLSGIFRVRDRLVELDDLRSFGPAMRIQPLHRGNGGSRHAVRAAERRRRPQCGCDGAVGRPGAVHVRGGLFGGVLPRARRASSRRARQAQVARR